jgi:hypothetical protein
VAHPRFNWISEFLQLSQKKAQATILTQSHYTYISHAVPHSRIGHYFFSYLLTCEVYLIEVLEIMAQMQQYKFFFEPETIRGDFRLNFELIEKSCRARHNSEISKTNTKTMISSLWTFPWCANIQPKLNKL